MHGARGLSPPPTDYFEYAPMTLTNHPDLLQQLAASYALGTLRGGARRRFEALARESVTIRTQALLWQERLASLTELQRSEVPSANVWKRIANAVDVERQKASVVAPQPKAATPRGVSGWWRGAAAAGALATVASLVVGVQQSRLLDQQASQLAQTNAANAQLASQREALEGQNVALTAQLKAQPDIAYVAVLADGKFNASMLVTFDARQQALVLKRVGGYQEAADKSLQLWALPASGGPMSLGVLDGNAQTRLVANDEQVRAAPALAVSLEPKGGVRDGGPTGPVLFSGRVLTTR